ncbi:MAG: TIGR02453 family protein, partial [Caldiserica bacterium CG02_land_8_20_14_3_00_36_38]
MFKGFSKETIDFLNNLKLNNSKGWFEANKEDYHKYLLRPFLELAEDLGPFMLSIDQHFNVTPKKIIS